MDQLELLKKDWKKQEGSLPTLSREELSKLIRKKSSSIVKWIFIISVLEFTLPNLLMFLTGYDKTIKVYEELELSNFMNIFYVISSVVIIYFIYMFYTNYKSICVSSNSKELMQSIIKTRKTVRYYILFSLSMIPIVSIVVLYKTFESPGFLEKINEDTNMILIWLVALFIVGIMVVLLWLFYKLIYGILLNRLMKNYTELASNGMQD